MSISKTDWIIAVAALVKDQTLEARIISLTDRFDIEDLDTAKQKAVQRFEELNRAWIDPASVEVTFVQTAPERRRYGM